MLVHKYIFYPADALFFCSAQAVVTKEMQNFYYGESVGSPDHAFVAEKDKCGKVVCEENGRFYSLVITVKEGEDAESVARKTFCAYFTGLAEMLSRPEEKTAAEQGPEGSFDLKVSGEERPQFLADIIDVFDDFLIENDVRIASSDEEMEENGVNPEENEARLYGSDYFQIEEDVAAALAPWNRRR